jgi:hypothetical protein
LLQIASTRDPIGDDLPITGVNMSKDLQPTVPSLIQFQQDLKLNGKGLRTQQSYLRALRKFHEFLSKDPASATEDDLRRYLLHVVDTKPWRPSTVNVAQQALKQFFRLNKASQEGERTNENGSFCVEGLRRGRKTWQNRTQTGCSTS